MEKYTYTYTTLSGETVSNTQQAQSVSSLIAVLPNVDILQSGEVWDMQGDTVAWVDTSEANTWEFARDYN